MIQKLEAAEITTEDLDFLLKSVAVGDEDSREVLKAIGVGTAVLWRISGKHCKGVMVTSVQSRSLYIWHFAGEGLWRRQKTLIGEIKAIATRNGLKSVVAQSLPPIAKLLTRHGFEIPRLVVEWRADG